MVAASSNRSRNQAANDADIRAARHVLRNLHNERSLRENPLTSRFFPALQTDDYGEPAEPARRAVVESVESLKAAPAEPAKLHSERHYIILTRYDLQHEPRSIVARELGIASSKFYYERRAALGRLALLLRNWQVKPASYFTEDRLALQQRCAIALKDLGRSDLSIALLENLVCDAPDGGRRIDVLCNLVESFCDAGNTKSAFETLKLARDAMANARASAEQARTLQARIDFASTQLAWLTGKTRAALETGERAIRLLRSTPSCAPSELLASLLSFTGDILTNAGSLDDGIAHFKEALETLGPGESAHISLRTVILANLAFAQAISPANMGPARKTNAEALELATRYRLLRSATQAHANEAQFQYWRGSLRPALSHSRIAQSISSALCHPIERSRLAILHARLEAFCGEERTALARVRSARKDLPASTYLYVLSQIIESEILTHSKAYASALRAAHAAAHRAELICSERGRGMAALALAQAYEGLGERKSAIEALESAIPALEHSRGLFPLAKAFECAARLTNSVRHRSSAADLMLSFKQ